MSKTGGCECGSTTYSLAADEPVHMYICHCLNCQTRSGSAFAEHAMIQAANFTYEGATVSHHRTARGMEFAEVFCAACHTRLFNHNSAMPGIIFLRAGTLSDSQALAPIAHIWTKRKQPWLALPADIPSFAESPTPEEFGAALQQAHSR
jgi:hypothetical protein